MEIHWSFKTGLVFLLLFFLYIQHLVGMHLPSLRHIFTRRGQICMPACLMGLFLFSSKGNRLCLAQPAIISASPLFSSLLIFSLLLARRADVLMLSSPATTQKCVSVGSVCPRQKTTGKDHSETEEEARVERKTTDKQLEVCLAPFA